MGEGSSGVLQQHEETLLLLTVEGTGGHGNSSTRKQEQQQHQREAFRLSLSSLQCADVVSFAAAAASEGRWEEAEVLLQRSLSLARRAYEAAAAAGEGEMNGVVLMRSQEEVQRLEEALRLLQQQRWQQKGKQPTASDDDFQVTSPIATKGSAAAVFAAGADFVAVAAAAIAAVAAAFPGFAAAPAAAVSCCCGLQHLKLERRCSLLL